MKYNGVDEFGTPSLRQAVESNLLLLQFDRATEAHRLQERPFPFFGLQKTVYRVANFRGCFLYNGREKSLLLRRAQDSPWTSPV